MRKLITGIGSLTQASSSSSVSPLLPSVSAPSGLDTQSIPCKFPCAYCLDRFQIDMFNAILNSHLQYIPYFFLSLLHRRLQQDGLVSRRCSNASRRRTGSGSGGNASSVSGGSNEYGEVPDPQVIDQLRESSQYDGPTVFVTTLNARLIRFDSHCIYP